MNKKRAQSGFTAIELLLALLILSIVITVITNMMISSYRMVNKAENRVDSQSQLRLNMDNVREELTTAVSVAIYDAVPTDATYLYIYVNNNTLVLQDGIGTPQPMPGALQLPGLTVEFQRSNLEERVVRIRFTSSEGSLLTSDIFIQNMTGAVSGIAEGDVIAFKRIN